MRSRTAAAPAAPLPVKHINPADRELVLTGPGAGWLQLDDNGAEWMTALGVANSAVSYWNARRLEQSAVDLRGLLAASKSVDVEDHYHLTMDVSGRNTGTLMMEVGGSSCSSSA